MTYSVSAETLARTTMKETGDLVAQITSLPNGATRPLDGPTAVGIAGAKAQLATAAALLAVAEAIRSLRQPEAPQARTS